MSVGSGTKAEKKEHWNPEKMNTKKSTQALFDNVTKVGDRGMRKIQDTFVQLSRETQNWVIISGIFLSVILLYLIITSLVQSQYTIFVPQKYRDMLAEARVNLDDATRMVDQPENF